MPSCLLLGSRVSFISTAILDVVESDCQPQLSGRRLATVQRILVLGAEAVSLDFLEEQVLSRMHLHPGLKTRAGLAQEPFENR